MAEPILGITEQWDTDALIEIRETILKHAGAPPLPNPLRIRTGAVPGTKGTSLKVKGFYVEPAKAEDGVPSFYISPHVATTFDALVTMTWLAIIAAYPDGDWKPKGNRAGLAERIGFERPYSTPKAESKLRVLIEEIETALIKPRPHAGIDVSKPIIQTQGTALLSGQCMPCLNANGNGKHRPTLATLKTGWPSCDGNGTHHRVLVNCWSGTRANGLTPVDPTLMGIPCKVWQFGTPIVYEPA